MSKPQLQDAPLTTSWSLVMLIDCGSQLDLCPSLKLYSVSSMINAILYNDVCYLYVAAVTET